ncbi:Glutathione S-transferase 1-1 [Armadillidium vulgare]|nr:Glutathione S-transferase 1-1 [Armadillidium vulgare]
MPICFSLACNKCKTRVVTMDLYYFNMSPPCRAVGLCAKTLGISVNKVTLLLTGEHLKPEFLAINPQHCIPTLVDGDLKLWESRAICTYLVSKYGKDDSLYPNNPDKRVLIDRLLYFDMGTNPLLKDKAPDNSALESTHEALKWFNDYYLDGHDFCVGNSLTVADFSLIATVSSIIEAGIDMSKYPNITEWVKRCESAMPGYESENGEGAKAFGGFIKNRIAETKA